MRMSIICKGLLSVLLLSMASAIHLLENGNRRMRQISLPLNTKQIFQQIPQQRVENVKTSNRLPNMAQPPRREANVGAHHKLPSIQDFNDQPSQRLEQQQPLPTDKQKSQLRKADNSHNRPNPNKQFEPDVIQRQENDRLPTSITGPAEPSSPNLLMQQRPQNMTNRSQIRNFPNINTVFAHSSRHPDSLIRSRPQNRPSSDSNFHDFDFRNAFPILSAETRPLSSLNEPVIRELNFVPETADHDENDEIQFPIDHFSPIQSINSQFIRHPRPLNPTIINPQTISHSIINTKPISPESINSQLDPLIINPLTLNLPTIGTQALNPSIIGSPPLGTPKINTQAFHPILPFQSSAENLFEDEDHNGNQFIITHSHNPQTSSPSSISLPTSPLHNQPNALEGFFSDFELTVIANLIPSIRTLINSNTSPDAQSQNFQLPIQNVSPLSMQPLLLSSTPEVQPPLIIESTHPINGPAFENNDDQLFIIPSGSASETALPTMLVRRNGDGVSVSTLDGIGSEITIAPGVQLDPNTINQNSIGNAVATILAIIQTLLNPRPLRPISINGNARVLVESADGDVEQNFDPLDNSIILRQNDNGIILEEEIPTEGGPTNPSSLIVPFPREEIVEITNEFLTTNSDLPLAELASLGQLGDIQAITPDDQLILQEDLPIIPSIAEPNTDLAIQDEIGERLSTSNSPRGKSLTQTPKEQPLVLSGRLLSSFRI